MYINFSVPNIVTVGIMFVGWMLIFHLLGQAGVMLPQWLSGNGN